MAAPDFDHLLYRFPLFMNMLTFGLYVFFLASILSVAAQQAQRQSRHRLSGTFAGATASFEGPGQTRPSVTTP